MDNHNTREEETAAARRPVFGRPVESSLPTVSAETTQAETRWFARSDRWLPAEYTVGAQVAEGAASRLFAVVAPGGIPKILKVVPLAGAAVGERELQGLALVRSIRHPGFLSLDRYHVVDDHLCVLMERADASLADEYKRLASQWMPGIPRARLLGMLWQAAEALDALAQDHGLQHLDVKPDNLFLVAGRLKLGDFGLVAPIDSKLERGRNIITPAYAAPESFEGLVSAACDQYSLAVLYMEMLTGERPFRGDDVRQLAYQHVTRRPHLQALPAPDRVPVGRALSRDPKKRFACCRDFIQALLANSLHDPSTNDPYARENIALSVPALLDLLPPPRPHAPPPSGATLQLHAGGAALTSQFIVEAPPSVVLGRLHGFIDDWGAVLVDSAAGVVTLRFRLPVKKQSWLRDEQEDVYLTLHAHQRVEADHAEATLVETTASFRGKRITADLFQLYGETLLKLVKLHCAGCDVPFGEERRKPRLAVDIAGTLTVDGAGGVKQVYRCTIVNVADGGLGVVTADAVAPGDGAIVAAG
ncbi:MAG: serine/threonine protein kinase, partial [Planctomycetia bacterium]